MKLLLDQGTARSTASSLRQSGVDALHVAEVGMSTAEDDEILEFAQTEQRVVVALDADFHALLALSGADSPSVIRIRVEGLKGQETADLLRQLMVQFADDLNQGAVLSVQAGRVRVRKLPLLPRT